MVSSALPVLLALFALVVSPVVASGRRDACQRAFEECDFRYEGITRLVPRFSLRGPPDVPFSPRIISIVPGENLGVLNTNGITVEVIFPNGRAFPITRFGNPRFTPTHIKPLSIPRTTGSGLGHQTFTGDQLRVASGSCGRIFFTQYQLLDRNSNNVVDNVNNIDARREKKCVVFRT